jgi:hypothetical protein
MIVGAAMPARACVNETGINRFGQPIPLDMPVDDLRYAMTHGVRSALLVDWAVVTVEQAREEPSFDNLNELAVVAMRLGRPKPAIRLLLALERKWPGRYETATHLGTALELAGADEVALRWIREGIRRNTDSH